MAANYATGISSSPQNLLQIVVSFLTTQGWTVDASASEGSGWRAHLHKNGLYVNFRAAMNELIWYRAAGPVYHERGDGGYGIGLYLGDGYSGASAFYAQSGGPVRSGDGTTIGVGANLPSGSVAAYHIFDDGADNIVVVVERHPGIFCHFGFGPAMAAAGQPEDFPYFFGSSSGYQNTDNAGLLVRFGINVSAVAPMSPGDSDYRSDSGSTPLYIHSSAFVRVDAATFAGRWVGNAMSTSENYGSTGRNMRCALNDNPSMQGACNESEYISYRFLRGRAHQTAYAGAILLPLHCFVLTDPAARWAPVGYPPSLFWCDAVGHGYSGGEEYLVGGESYIVFPGFAVWKGA